MVGTHYDQVANCSLPEAESPEALQRLIRSSVMGAPDADKLGLPRVMDSLEVKFLSSNYVGGWWTSVDARGRIPTAGQMLVPKCPRLRESRGPPGQDLCVISSSEVVTFSYTN